MASEFLNPAEIPAELGGGGSGGTGIPPRGGIGGPAELPPFLTGASSQELFRELFRLRDRVHVLESQQLALRLWPGRPPIAELPRFPQVGPGAPNELPEGGEGGGGIPRPIGEIAELPITSIGQILEQVGSLRQLLGEVETRLAKELRGLSERVDALAR